MLGLNWKLAIADAKLVQIVPLVQYIIPTATTEDVRAVCLSSHPEGKDHQRWLDTAPPNEIALWVISHSPLPIASEPELRRFLPS